MVSTVDGQSRSAHRAENVAVISVFKDKRRGFTIIELLVVIVVIAILATITVVTYSGIQARAFDAKRASALSTYVKLFTMYKDEHGAYPIPSAGYACLGERSHYQKVSRWSSEGGCYGIDVGASIHPVISVDDGINNKLREYAANLPDAAYKTIEDGDGRHRGPQYFPSSYGQAQIIYLDSAGQETCAWGGQLWGDEVEGGLRQCTIILK